MAGHSKWHKVKHFKGAVDAKRAKIFAKLSRELMIAARQGGGDPDLNPRLRMVILKCKSVNMPSENIERAIKKALGASGEAERYEELLYEVIGPGGVGLLVEVQTDNRNRTASEIRTIVTRNGGTMASAGAVSRLFERKGHIIITRDKVDEDTLMELALEAGAEDLKVNEDVYELITAPSTFEQVHKAVTAKGITCENAEVTFLPMITTRVEDAEQLAALNRLIELLEDHDDVKEVHSNAEFPDNINNN